jgi:hypothetical protein
MRAEAISFLGSDLGEDCCFSFDITCFLLFSSEVALIHGQYFVDDNELWLKFANPLKFLNNIGSTGLILKDRNVPKQPAGLLITQTTHTRAISPGSPINEPSHIDFGPEIIQFGDGGKEVNRMLAGFCYVGATLMSETWLQLVHCRRLRAFLSLISCRR